MMPQLMTQPLKADPSTGGRLVTADGRTLPLKSATITASARGGIARVVLEQRFANPFDEPLMITYLMPLPADGAVSGYAFTLGDRRIVGEVDRKQRARERFEDAILEGRTAALVEQERSSLFRQELGNVPPRAEIVAELTIDQRLIWMNEGAWEWRFPTVVSPRYQGAPGRVPDAAQNVIEVADAPLPIRVSMALSIGDTIVSGRRAESPSHALRVSEGQVTFAEDQGARLDRDVVVRWPVAALEVGATISIARPAAGKPASDGAYGLITIVPPSPDAPAARPVPRDLIVLLDTSGSMGGEPLDQARRVVGALVQTLTDEDRLEMIEFSNAPRRWKGKAVAATENARRDALQWLARLQASGGTEMKTGVLEALAPLRKDGQRQIVLVTDGQIGFEAEVVGTVLDDLPPQSRLHTVGVGSAVNRSLTGPAARAGRGVEIVIGLGEDPERAVKRLLARTTAPILTEVELSGSALVACAPAKLPDLFAGAPALVGVKLRPEGGELIVRGKTAFPGGWERRLSIPPSTNGDGDAAITALFARELVEDLETKRAAAGASHRELDRAIETIGVDFQISTRLTSWIAVSTEITVDGTSPTRKVNVPHELPHGVSAEGLGLRNGSIAHTAFAMPAGAAQAPMPVMAAPTSRPAKKASPISAVADAVGAMGRAAAGILGSLGGGAGARKDDVTEAGESEPIADLDDESPQGELRRETRAGWVSVDDKPAAPEPKKEAEEKARAKQVMPPRLHGRIVKRKGNLLVVEVTMPVPFDFSHAMSITVHHADGSMQSPTLDTKKSTRAGKIAAGQTIRLVLMLPLDPATPTEVNLDGTVIVLEG
jgi:Ca-activated chloride channel family protein